MRHGLLLILLPLVGAANPRRVADLNQQTATRSGRPNFFVTAGLRTFFAGTDSLGNELWVTDGTGPGTRRVADVNPGTASSLPVPLGAIGSEVVFAATRPDVGRELFISDGTAAGTRLLRDITPGPADGLDVFFNENPAAELNGAVLFGAGPLVDQELWRTDGTTAGTQRVTELNPTAGSNPRGWTTFGGRVVFIANGQGGTELYVTDGSAAGTTLVADLNPGSASSLPGAFTPLFGWLYFIANDGTNGPELHRWNGTGAPVRLSTIASSPSAFFTIVGTDTSEVYFSGEGPAGHELYRFDTASLAVTAFDVNPGPASSSPRVCADISSQVYCVFDGDGMTADVYRISGTSAVAVADLNPGPGGVGAVLYASGSSAVLISALIGSSRHLISLRAFGDFTDTGLTANQVESASGPPTSQTVMLAANDGVHGDELWSVSAFGTRRLVRDMYAGTASSTPSGFTADGDRALFSANVSSQGYELFETLGTEATTKQLTSMLGFGAAPSLVVAGSRLIARSGVLLYGADRATATGWDVLISATAAPALLDGVLYFPATSPSTGLELWRSDGTIAGTRLAAEVTAGPTNSLLSTTPATLSAGLVFSVSEAGAGTEPWFSDGTQAGTRRLADLNPGAASSNPFHLTRAGTRVFFFATAAATGTELYVTDGTATTLVTDAVPGAMGLTALNAMAGASDRVYFISGPDVWASDGTAPNTRRVATAVTVFGGITTAGPKAFFSGLTPAQGRELWVSDGTTAGTAALDLAPGLAESNPSSLFAIGSEVLFAANGADGAGIELWRSDGTVPGTRRVADLAMGAADSLPRNFGRVGSKVYFSATDLDGDEELWVYELDTTPPTVTATVTGNMGGNGFYTSDVTISFTVTETESTAVLSGDCAGAVVTADTAGRPFNCTATSAGGMASAMAVVKRDTQPPVVTCPADQVVEATSPGGAMVTLELATAVDNIEATPGVDPQPRSGPFPLGTTVVTETATDGAGNAGTCRHNVIVRDTTAPVPMCPGDQALDGSSAVGGVVSFGVSATDNADTSPLVLTDHASGGLFPSGETTVTVTAIDDSGNAGTCTFKVTVAPGGGGCGCTGAPGAGLVLLALLALGRRRAPRS